MDENILGFAVAIDEAIALDAIEPLYLHRLERTGRFGERLAVGPFAWRNGGSRRRRQGSCEIDRQDSPGLEPALEPIGFRWAPGI